MMIKAAKTDRVSNYVSPRCRSIFLDRRRGDALLSFVEKLAAAGDADAAAFLDALFAGAFDDT
jgi:hypothetical protein